MAFQVFHPVQLELSVDLDGQSTKFVVSKQRNENHSYNAHELITPEM